MPIFQTSTPRKSMSKCRRCKRVREVHYCGNTDDCFAEGLCKVCAQTAGEPQRRLIIFELEGLPPIPRYDLAGHC